LEVFNNLIYADSKLKCIKESNRLKYTEPTDINQYFEKIYFINLICIKLSYEQIKKD